MFRKRNLLLGIGLSAILAVGCEPPEYNNDMETTATTEESQTDTNTYGGSDQQASGEETRQAGIVSKDQANELNGVVKNLFENVNKASKAIKNNQEGETEEARGHIEDAQTNLEDLRKKVQEFGLAAGGVQGAEGVGGDEYGSAGDQESGTEYSRGNNSEMSGTQSQLGSQVVRIPVYEGSQLVTFTRLISEAREESGTVGSTSYGHGDMSGDSGHKSDSSDGHGDMSGDSGHMSDSSDDTVDSREDEGTSTYGQTDESDTTTYGRGDMSDTSSVHGDGQYGSGSTYGDDQYGSDTTTYGRGTIGSQSFVVIDLADLGQNLSEASVAAQSGQLQQAEQALEDIQTQAVNIEYSSMQQPLKRIGEKMARAKSAVEKDNFEKARSALQEVDSELAQFSRQASEEARGEIEEVRNDIQSWSAQLEENASDAGDKLEGWWNEMSDWFNTEVASQVEPGY